MVYLIFFISKQLSVHCLQPHRGGLLGGEVEMLHFFYWLELV